MKVLTTTVARVVFALPFGVFGLTHFFKANDMAGIVPGWVPGGVFWVYVTGAALVAACVSLIVKKMARESSLGLAALMLTFVLTVHIPGLGNEAMAQMATVGLLKDMALMGGALTYAGLMSKK